MIASHYGRLSRRQRVLLIEENLSPLLSSAHHSSDTDRESTKKKKKRQTGEEEENENFKKISFVLSFSRFFQSYYIDSKKILKNQHQQQNTDERTLNISDTLHFIHSSMNSLQIYIFVLFR